MFKPYKPKTPKNMPGVNVQIAGHLKKAMGPVKVPKRYKVFNKGNDR